ncbi:hypothetical protein AL755_21715 [Arthrobacter sp. ERGS1:01]|uniref:hypothetical protein n=1 Tax=Arthrobacter sp. ERGS1:01 TaxID=1704044 RepID=UPI0006CB37FB|nr:hypothetical protein [Arthrobacter sp. ERGS1:01]ALE07489.1 hypothetical protein AL755_21715 [Arthrobacter sp. ERGS1:01]
MKGREWILAMCLALGPADSRAVRNEQLRADLRDCTEMGISQSSLLFGALRSSATARAREMTGRNLRLVLCTLGVALALVSGTLVGLHTTQHQVHATAQESSVASESAGSSAVQQDNTVSVDTATGDIREAFVRAKNEGKQLTLISGKDSSVVVDPSVTMDSVTILDAKSGAIIDSFPVDKPAG